jgi:hypothetical protein
MAEALQQKLQAASEAIETQPTNAVAQLREILLGSYPNDAEALKVKESALDMLAASLVKQKDTAGLRTLLTDLRPWFGVIPKAKTAKIVRTIIESIGKVPDSTQVLVSHSCSLLFSFLFLSDRFNFLFSFYRSLISPLFTSLSFPLCSLRFARNKQLGQHLKREPSSANVSISAWHHYTSPPATTLQP